MDLPQKGFELRHTTMPARTAHTLFGDVTLTSRKKRDRYMLVASGSLQALRWLFNHKPVEFQKVSTSTYRHDFVPAPFQITVMRKLEQVCAQWQERWEERLQNAQIAGDQVPVGTIHPENLTLSQLVGRYQTAREGELAPATMERDRHYLNRWLKELGGDSLVHDIVEEQVVAARTELAKGLMVSTINCMFATFRTVMRWATDRGLISDDVYRHIRPFREVRNAREKPWWTTTEVEVALRCAVEVDDDLHRNPKKDISGTATLLIALGCLLGLRYEEIVMLKWSDLDLEALDVTTGLPAPVAHIVPKEGWSPKDGEARAVPIHERLVSILRKYRQDDGYVLRAHSRFKKVRTGTKRVYRYDPKKIWLRVLEKVMATGAKRITPHGMRHSFASNLLMAGASDVLVSRWLGHADTTMLHQTYGHLLAYHGDINKVRFGVTPHSGLLPEEK